MVYLEKSDDGKEMAIDWEAAQLELQKEIEENNRKQEEENEKRKKEEMENYKKDLEEKYEKEKIEIEEKLRKQVKDYEDKMKEMNQSVEKSKVENDRKNVEILMQERLKLLEQDKIRKKREYEQRERAEQQKREIMKKNQETIHKSEKLEQNLHNVVKKLNKMKIIINELKRNVNLDIYLSKNILEHFNDAKNTTTNILIRVENFEEGSVYYWTTETFQNRYDMMKELFDKYQDEDFDIFNLKNEEDPLWDEHKPHLLGYAIYKLEPLAYLMNNPTTSMIVSPNGVCSGNISLDIIPIDEEGLEFEDVPDDPYELVGTAVNFKVYIKEASDLPDMFCRGVYVEYTSLNDNLDFQSRVVEEKTKNPVFEDMIEHKIDYLTKDDIDYLLKEKVL